MFDGVSRDADAPEIRWERVCVRDVETPDLGIKDSITSDVGELKARGVGDLLVDAHRDIEERIDLEEHVDEVVAEVFVDVESWEYEIEMLVDEPMYVTARRLLRGCVE